MMTKQTEALKRAIEWVEGWKGIAPSKIELLRVLREALEQPAQEPVACHCGNPTFNLQSITHTKLKCFEQTTQEPVAWTDKHNLFLEWDKESLCYKAVCKDHEAIPLYTHPAPQPAQEVKCNQHPDAPHGFMRDESHSQDRYVCECEYWTPPAQEPDGTTLYEMNVYKEKNT